MTDRMSIVVIGIGGIGGWLLRPLLRYLNYEFDQSEVTLIDGDEFESDNADRQSFSSLRNKAEERAEVFRQEFSSLRIRSQPEYVTDSNVFRHIQPRTDVVFLSVDNHATRKLVSDRCEQLNDICLISGGNDYTSGNVQIHLTRNGDNVTLPIGNQFHMEIMNPEDANPGERGCDEVVESEPQLLMTNHFIASLMLNAFERFVSQGGDGLYDEVYADCRANKTRPVSRS